MDSVREYIESKFIYERMWLRYKLYSSINYRVYLPNGVYILLNEKPNYMHTNKTDYMFQVYIEPGHKIYQINNLKVKKNQLKYIKIEDYLDNMFKNTQKVDFLTKMASGGVI